MQAAGYRYVNVDEGWKQSSRDSNGNLQASTSFLTTYPTMSALASYVHNLGYKFGLYVTEGTTACVGSSAPSAGYEYQDANLLSSWGIDFLKIDECNGMAYDSDPNVWASASSNYLYQAVWGLWSAALRSTGRQIFNYIASGPVGTVSAQWASQAGGNMWRIGPDIGYQWSTVDPYFDLLATAGLAGQAGPTKGWNDPDALIVGNVNLTDTQGQTQMSLWAINAAPLISSVDLTTLSANSLATLTNSEVIAVDQDPFGAQGVRISKTACGSGSSTGNNYCEVWAKQLTGTNTCAIGLFNRSGTAQSITATFATIAASIPACGSGPYTTTRDLWAHASLGTLTTSYTASSIPAYGSVMIKVAP
jgi:alpha-galactosidase